MSPPAPLGFPLAAGEVLILAAGEAQPEPPPGLVWVQAHVHVGVHERAHFLLVNGDGLSLDLSDPSGGRVVLDRFQRLPVTPPGFYWESLDPRGAITARPDQRLYVLRYEDEPIEPRRPLPPFGDR